MIDNNNKSSLHNGWNMRIIVIYFSNGLKEFSEKLGQDYIIVIFDRLLDFLEIPLFNLEA